MMKYLAVAFALVFAALPASAHKASKFVKGPNGGHIVDAGGGIQHWELVASGGELTLHVTDKDEKPVDTKGGSAEARVLVGGKNYTVTLSPAGANTLKGSGDFKSANGMRVIVKTNEVGGKSYQARLTPLG
jgi:hypothetical protein